MNGRHPFAFTLKGQFSDSRGPLGQLRLVYPCLQARHNYRPFGRVANRAVAAWIFGIFAISAGILSIALAFSVRGVGKRIGAVT